MLNNRSGPQGGFPLMLFNHFYKVFSFLLSKPGQEITYFVLMTLKSDKNSYTSHSKVVPV